MDLIENLSKDFVNTMREKLYGWVQRSHITDSNTAEAKDNGIYCEFNNKKKFAFYNCILNIVFDEF